MGVSKFHIYDSKTSLKRKQNPVSGFERDNETDDGAYQIQKTIDGRWLFDFMSFTSFSCARNRFYYDDSYAYLIKSPLNYACKS